VSEVAQSLSLIGLTALAMSAPLSFGLPAVRVLG
jgi:hypothetical protein